MATSQESDDDLQVAPVSRRTMQDEVYRQICELILDGGIAPGQQVTIQNLAKAFQVSAMPVREALKRLTAAEALTVVSGRTIGIPNLSPDRLKDLRNVRMEIEPAVGAWAAERIQPSELASLVTHFEELDRATADGDVMGYIRANRAFHFNLYRAAGSEVAMPIIESLWLQISPYFHLLRESGNFNSSNIRHSEMLKGLQKGDANAVSQALREDISGAYRDLARLFE